MAEPAGDRPPPPASLALEVLEAVVVAVLFAVFARAYVVQAFKIPSTSMEKNLQVGDHILVNKFIYGPTRWPIEEVLLPVRSPRRGDVVVFKFPQDPSRDFIKRCVGLPGDTVEIADKGLILDGEPVEEGAVVYLSDTNVYRSRFVQEPYRQRDNFGPYRVPQGHYFCLGDNRDDSHDSRFWGPVPRSHVKGRALLIYWSWVPPEESPADGDATALVRLGRHLQSLIAATRWDRCLRLVR